MISRRTLLGELGAVALATSSTSIQAGWFGDALIGSLGGAAVIATGGFLAIAGATLLGWKTIKLMGDADTLVGHATPVIDHIDNVLNEVSTTLKNIDMFVQDCDAALKNIEDTLKQLPGDISAAFNAAEAAKELGFLRGQGATLAAYLRSRSSIQRDAERIQNLCERMIKSISAYGALEQNSFQFTMQTVPAITTWVQGYLAYNVLRTPAQRDINPWDHAIVSSIVIPRFNDVILKLSNAKPYFDQLSARTVTKVGVLYQDTTYKPVFPYNWHNSSDHVMKETKIPFKWLYSKDEIDDGLYYAICPGPEPTVDDAYWRRYATTSHRRPPIAVDAKYMRNRDYPFPLMCYLVQDRDNLGYRYWSSGTNNLYNDDSDRNWFLNDPKAADARAFEALEDLIMTNIEPYAGVLAFHRIADGLDAFRQTVKEQLIIGNRDQWLKMPKLPT